MDLIDLLGGIESDEDGSQFVKVQVDKMIKYFLVPVSRGDKLSKEIVKEYIEKNVSYGVSSGFYQNEKEVIFTDKDIYDKFIPYIADFLFDTLEHYYNRDMQILRISQLFSEIIKEYIDYQ